MREVRWVGDDWYPTGEWDLLPAITNNPGCGITLSEVNGANIHRELVGEHDEKDWHWLIELPTGEWVYLAGGCDYTGWDCQSHLEVFRAPTEQEALAQCPQDILFQFQEMAKEGIESRPNN